MKTAAATPDQPDEGEGYTGPDPEVLAEAVAADERERKWFALLTRFVNDRAPIWADEGPGLVTRHTTAAVNDAEGRAVIAAFRAIETLASRFAPPPSFTIDARKAGRG